MAPSEPDTRLLGRLLDADDEGWNELDHLFDSLRPDQALRPAYFTEGWSVKDLIGHLGSWLAEACVALTTLGTGTYRPSELNIEAKNDEFLEALRPLPLLEARAQAQSAHTRMLQEMGKLPELSPEAVEWIEKGGARHYAEHLPRLRVWVAELLEEGFLGRC